MNHADRITVPVMLVHGEQDQRVPFEQAKKMRKALADLGRPPEWLAEPHEGHGFYDEGARERMAGKLLEFLQRCTGVQAAAGAPAGAAPAPAGAATSPGGSATTPAGPAATPPGPAVVP